MPSTDELSLQLQDAHASLAAAIARIHSLKLKEKRLSQEKTQLIAATAHDHPTAEVPAPSKQEDTADAHDVYIHRGSRKVPGNLIISQNQLEFHAIEARVKHADFVGISTATKPVSSDSVPPPLEAQATPEKAAWMCCLTASAADDGPKQNGAPRLPANFDNLDGIDDYHADRLVEIQQPSGAWKIIWKQGGLPNHLVFEASEKTREAMHQCTERWLGLQSSGEHVEDDALASAKQEVVPPLQLPPGSYLPPLNEPSSILTEPLVKSLAAVLPGRHQHKGWGLLYSTSRHGISLSTLYRRCAGTSPCILLVKDEAGYVFGAYTAEPWRVAPRFYGTGETFMFQLEPNRVMYPWKRGSKIRNEYFQLASPDSMAVGGAGGPALWVDGELECGTSACCATFGSPSLSFREEFRVACLELWHVL